ncbi:hypothetical protein EON81_03895 [bacterium]|nr:MAG: hypothetical protein EON81_03895 [bacterium]
MLVVGLFGWFVWPTRWTYEVEYQSTKSGHRRTVRIRTDRFTGEEQSDSGDGWSDGRVIID